MNSKQKWQTKATVFPLLLLALGLNSCKKSKSNQTDENQSGAANVTIRMLGVDETTETLGTPDETSSSSKLAVNAEKVQTRVVPFNKDLSITATLVPEGTAAGSDAKDRLSTNAAGPGLKPLVLTQKPLDAGVKYRVIVYNAAGTYFKSKDYAFGNETTVDGIMGLDGGKTYTFTAYSLNSKTAPLISVSPMLGASLGGATPAKLDAGAGDFMFFSQQVTVAAGNNNYVGVILRHKNTQITTKITLSGVAANIGAISGVTFSPSKASAPMRVSNGTIDYSAASSVANVTFPAIAAGGVVTLTSNPTIVVNDGTAPGQLTIGSLTISGVTKTNIVIPNLTMTPGVKYNLNLNINVDCGGQVNLGSGNTSDPADLDYNMSQTSAANPAPVNTKSITFPARNDGPLTGITFFVSRFANSFDMVINGKHLIRNAADTDHELVFDNNPGYTQVKNIGFRAANGGGTYGDGTNAHIYDLVENDTPDHTDEPVLQMQIDFTETGANVIIFGKQVNGGDTFALRLLAGYTYNHIDWNQTGDNTITISQKVNGPTFFQAYVNGGKARPCNP